MSDTAPYEHIDDVKDDVDRLQNLLYKTIEKRKDLADDVEDLHERVQQLEAENERLQARLDDTKEDKVTAILEFAENKREDGTPAVKVTPKEIKGATGVTRRYAYDLCDDLPDQYDFFLTTEEMQQYGSIELDLSSQQRCVGVDLEGVHSAGSPLNRFTTASEENGGE